MVAFLLAFGQTMTSVVALTAATYILKGTNSAFNQIPDSAYPPFAQKYDTAVGVSTPRPRILVPYPATFRPFTPPGFIFSPTFDQSVATGVSNLEGLRPVNSTSSGDVLWGYSQGATVVTMYKRDYNAQPNPPATAPTFVLVANPNRPNGGILERGVALGTIPILGLTFSGATPTQTAGQPEGTVTTYDIARQYDGVADAPVNPVNLLADLNAVMGFIYLHGKYPDADPTTAIYQGQYGDTKYYLIPTYPLPLLMPLESIPVIGSALADTLDPPLRVIVESAYDRSTSPGDPTPFNPLYFPNPVTFGTALLVAIPTGLDNGISDLTGMRLFGTTRPGPYGVGGPPTVGIDGQPTPTPGTPTAGPAPTIPVLFGSPAPDGGQPTGFKNDGMLTTSFAAAKLALAPPASDPKPGKDEVKTPDNGLTVSPNAGNQQLMDLGSKNPQPKPKPFKPFKLNPPSPTANEPTTPKVRKPSEPDLPRIRDLIPSPRNGFDKPAKTKPGEGDAPSQASPSGSRSPAGAAS